MDYLNLLHLLLHVSIFVVGLLFVPFYVHCRFFHGHALSHIIRGESCTRSLALVLYGMQERLLSPSKCHVRARGRTGMTNDHEGSIGYWHAMYARGYINESCPRGRILREYETLMDRCVFADGNEWPVAACRFILDERFCRGGYVESTPRNHYDGNISIISSFFL